MAKIRYQHGFSKKETMRLSNYWKNHKLAGQGWDSCGSFTLWARDSGWKPLKQLRKIDPRKPHGPDNSFWQDPQEEEPPLSPGHPCLDCDNQTRDRCGTVCRKRLDYWDAQMAAIRRNLGL